MKVLYSHYLAHDRHPAACMVEAIAAEMREIGHEVRVHRSRGPELPEGPESSREGRSRTAALRGKVWFARELGRNRAMDRRDSRAIDDFRPDIVVARQDAYCSSMAQAAARAGVPLVTYADAPVALEARRFAGPSRWHPPGLVEAVESRVLRASRAIVTVSGPAAQVLAAYKQGAPIHVVPNGVHPGRFPEVSAAERTRRRADLGINSPLVLAFAGSFKPFHGIGRLRDLILATFGRPEVHWLLIGDGPGRAELREAVGGLGSVTFLGRRPPESVGALLALADIAVAPHEIDDGPFYFCPLKILEYGAAGCAVVAGDQGDIPELLDGGRAGVLVRENRAVAWTSALDRLIDDPEGRRRLGREARRRVLGQFTWRHTAEAVGRVLRETLSPSSRTPDLCGGSIGTGGRIPAVGKVE